MHEAAFPDDLSLAVRFYEIPFASEAVTSIYSLPATSDEGHAVFLIFGLAFKLEGGEGAKTLRPFCALHSPQQWIFLSPQEEIVDWLGDWLLQQKPVGSLTTLEKRDP